MLASETVRLVGRRAELWLSTPCGQTSLDVRDKEGWSPLHVACRAGNRPAARCFLEKGACVTVRGNIKAETPLHVAWEYGKAHLIHDLIKHGADLPARTDDGETCFAMACRYGHIPTMKALCWPPRQELVDERMLLGETCLHRACSDINTTEMVKVLLFQFGAQTNLRTVLANPRWIGPLMQIIWRLPHSSSTWGQEAHDLIGLQSPEPYILFTRRRPKRLSTF